MDNTVEVQVQELGKVMITNRGEYISSKSYEILDIVSYNGSSFMSKIDDNTSVPAEEISPDELLINENWQLVAKKGDTYKVTKEDLQAIAKQITDNAKSAFNQNVETKTKEFNTNVTNKLSDYDTNAKSTTETFDANAKKKLDEYNTNDTKKLKAYNDNADNKLSAYNTNDTNKLKAYNTNADSKIEEYNTNANSKIAEYDEHSEKLRKLAVSTDNELERIKNGMLGTGSASDTFIHIEDSCMAKLKELEIEGVCEQETTSGKNLLNVAKDLQQIKSDSYSITPVYSNGMLKYIELNGTFDEWKRYSILGAEFTLSSGTYTQSFHKEGTLSNGSVYIDSSLSITSIESDNFSKVLDEDLNVLKYSVCVNKGTICNNLRLYPMIAKEEKVSNYEPFTNGTSPNSDYPQEIENIANIFNIISCNKNIFNFNETKNLKTYNSEYKFENNILEITPLTQWGYVEVIQKVKPNTTYVYSFEMDFEGIDKPSTWWVSLNDNNGTDYNKGLISFKDNKIIKVIRTTDSCQLQIKFTSSTATKPTKTIFKNIQLEENTSLTNYEMNALSKTEVNLPEGEFIGKLGELCKDTLRIEYNQEDGMYHLMLDKKVGKYTFTGNENWSTYTQSNGMPVFRCTLPVGNSILVKSNYFVSQTTWANVLVENRIFNHIGNYQNIEISCSKFDTLTNFKNFLTTNVVQMYHALKIPYTLDLGTINMPLSYKKITNIFTDSDLLSTINAKYYRTFQTTIQNLQINEKSLKQEIIDLNVSLTDITKRLEALESANVSTVEESEASNDLQN